MIAHDSTREAHLENVEESWQINGLERSFTFLKASPKGEL